MTALITAADVPEIALADAKYSEPRPGSCSCRSVREGAGGFSYSYEILGVNCPECEGFMADCEQVDRWNALTREERIEELVRFNNVTAALEPASGGEEPPF